MHKWILVTIGIFVFSSLEAQSKIKFEPPKAIQTVNQLISKLDSSYELKSSITLKAFLDEWNLTIKPNEEKYIKQSDVIKSIYDLFATFYIPSSPFSLGQWERFHIPDSSLQYFIIQNKIRYSILPEKDFDKFDLFNRDSIEIMSIYNFKPQLDHLSQERILYLTREYENALKGFLGSEYQELGKNNIMTPSLPKGESFRRYGFLKKYIHILPGHWGGYWHLETHPKVSLILINEEYTKAKIDFRYGYQGGETVLEKKDGKWVIVSSKATWME